MPTLSINDVSVLIPVYNAEKTIQRAVDSVLLTGNLPKEILIYDDASNDRTREIIEQHYGSNKRIKLIKAKKNLGAGVARQELLKAASGGLLAFLDADDEWLKNKLAQQVTLMNRENADLCICSYEIYSDKGEYIGKRTPPKTVNYFKMHLANWIPTSMVVFRSDLLNIESMSELRQRQDYAYWLMLLRSNPSLKISVVKEILGNYYRQTERLSSNKIVNLRFNYKVFNEQVGYNRLTSLFLVILNILTRVVRA